MDGHKLEHLFRLPYARTWNVILLTVMNFKPACKTKMNNLSSFFLFLVITFVLTACEHSPSLDTVSVQGRTMGTTYSVKVVGAKSDLPSDVDLKSWADAVFVDINQSMSTYIPDSELSVLNTSIKEQWQPVSSDLLYVLSLSQKISHLSSGSFDITVAPLVNLWGFGPKAQRSKIPSEETIASVRASVGFKNLSLDLESKSIQKPAGLALDLSAVAKGYAVDALAAVLLEKGYTNFMVEVGGELYLLGLNGRGSTWTIGIETPSYELLTQGQAPVRAVALSGKGMATSGDYRNYYEEAGVRYSHTIDPLTGSPISHNLASVTVIANECAEADALATALNVMGAQKAMALAEEIGLAAYLIIRKDEGFTVRYSSAFRPYLVKE